MKIVSILIVLSFVLLGCGKETRKEKGINNLNTGGKARARNAKISRSGWSVTKVDLNKDDKPDQWILSKAGQKRIERDLNFDGKVDVWSYLDKNGSIVEEEMDLDKDQRVDLVIYYSNGIMTRKELSTDFSGLFTIVKFYDQKGQLLRIERDEDGDSRVDIWEYYESNRAVRTGWDTTNDGKPDTFDNLG